MDFIIPFCSQVCFL